MLKISPMNFFISGTLTSVQEFHVDMRRNGLFALITRFTYSFVLDTKLSTNSSVKMSPKKNIGLALSGLSIFKPGFSLKGKSRIVGVLFFQLSRSTTFSSESELRSPDDRSSSVISEASQVFYLVTC